MVVMVIPTVSVSRAAITKYYKLGIVKNRKTLFHSFGGSKSKGKMPVGLVPSESFKGKLLHSSILASNGFSSNVWHNLAYDSTSPIFT